MKSDAANHLTKGCNIIKCFRMNGCSKWEATTRWHVRACALSSNNGGKFKGSISLPLKTAIVWAAILSSCCFFQPVCLKKRNQNLTSFKISSTVVLCCCPPSGLQTLHGSACESFNSFPGLGNTARANPQLPLFSLCNPQPSHYCLNLGSAGLSLMISLEPQLGI